MKTSMLQGAEQGVAGTVSQRQVTVAQFVDRRVQAGLQTQLQRLADNSPRGHQAVQLRALIDSAAPEPAAVMQKKENKTGLPDGLKSGIESLSNMSMDHVKVHYNSPQPAQLNAHAYAQGSEIHVAPGQEQHLPHEAWHVVQQAQGRVQPTRQMKAGVAVNDDAGLEAEADVMGARALQMHSKQVGDVVTSVVRQPMMQSARASNQTMPVQRVLTRSMYNVVAELVEAQSSDEQATLALTHSSYGHDTQVEMWNLFKKMQSDTNAGDDQVDESTEVGEDLTAEVGLNIEGHGGISDDGIEDLASYKAMQLKRTGNAMTGPKDYTSSNGASYEDAFYILDGQGGLDFSTTPTKGNHTAHTPAGKRKKGPLKHSAIKWSNPVKSGSAVDLSTHPKASQIDKTDRPQHFGMADKLLAGTGTASSIAAMRAGKWTWHHMPTPYHMVLVDMEAHALHGHNGGVYLW